MSHDRPYAVWDDGCWVLHCPMCDEILILNAHTRLEAEQAAVPAWAAHHSDWVERTANMARRTR